MKFITNLLISAIIVFVLARYLIPGVEVAGFGSAIMVALVIGFLNAVVKPILSLLSLPITILTLGLFSFVITAIIIYLASILMGSSFHVSGFFPALLFGLALGIFNAIFGGIGSDD